MHGNFISLLITRTSLDCINLKLMYQVQILPPIQVRKTGIVIEQQTQIRKRFVW